MNSTYARLCAPLACLAMLATGSPALAQGSATASLTGSVVDAAGGVVPGAIVAVKNNATGGTYDAVSNSSGVFSVPALEAGTYTVTVSLQGFKTVVISNVRLVTATQGNVKATLEVGSLEETVTVKGGTELVQTQASAITSTISAEQIKNLPLVSRNALYFTTFLPGVETQAGPRGSTIMGLPQNTINITIDGVSNSNNFQSTDGFFSMVTPRLDAVEEITVTGATPGANNAGSGAVNIAFVTRSGTNTFDTSIYHYFRHPSLNSNYYFNKVNGLDRNEVIVHQYGGRVGGPIIIPGLFDGRNKAFFFFNFERLHQPSEATRTRTVLNPQAQQGLYTYTASGTTRSINVLALAAQNGQVSTIDPTIGALLGQMNAAMQTTGTLSTPVNVLNTQRYVYQSAGANDQYAPTTRVDLNLTDRHRLSGTYYWQRFLSKPDLLNNRDPQFPGFPNLAFQTSYRTTGSIGMRSTLGKNLVNDVKAGWQWSPNSFFANITSDMFKNQQGFDLAMTANNTDFSNVTDATAASNKAPRNTTNWGIDDNVSWLKGTHSLTMGASFAQIIHDQNDEDVVPGITFGLDVNNDPARTMFSTATFPNASTAQLNSARYLYALLTGRITAINGTARLNNNGEYVYLGNLNDKSKMNEAGLYAQDSWRVKPNLTLNYGLRWEVQMPFTAVSTTWSTASLADLCGISGIGQGIGGRQCNLFQPGTIEAPNLVPQYTQYTPGARGYKTDWNNLAPNGGVAWQPNVEGGWLRKLLGDPDQATVRAGYSLSFNRERMDRFTEFYGANVGGSTNISNRNNNNGNLIPAGQSWPLLLRETSRLGPPPFPATANYPITASITAGNDINVFDSNIETPSTQSWSIGLQRAFGADTAIEVRYVGNRNRNAWATENWNTPNIVENKFLDEFKLAQANLAANVAAGGTRAGSFAYFGPGTGTSPLPIYLAYLQGLPAAQAGNHAQYTSAQWTNSTWIDQLGLYEPNPRGAATSLWTGNSGAWRTNAATAGLPRNFFVMNPDVDQANITRSNSGSYYHSMQFEVRRRLSQGFTAQGSYTYARRFGLSTPALAAGQTGTLNAQNADVHRERVYLETDAVPHAFKVNWLYQIPIGRDRTIGGQMHPVLNAVIGNWEFSGSGRVQIRDFGVAAGRLVGMSEKELEDAFDIRVVQAADGGTVTLFNLPDDIILNTRRAFNSSPTSPTGYPDGEAPTGRYIAPASSPGCIALYVNDCGTADQLWVRGPWFSRWDFTAKKRFPFGRKASVEISAEMLNVFDNVNFNPQFNPGNGATIFQVTTAYTDINTTYDPGGRIGQLVWRINW